jgi:DNA-binding CsgD family transcriptional regulator
MTTLAIGFHTAPIKLFFRVEPDYSILQPKFEMLDFMASMKNTSICVLDFYKHEYAYISDNHLFMCGNSMSEIKEKGQRLAEEIIFEEDKMNQANMKDALFMFIHSIERPDKTQFSLYTTHRLRQKDGKVFLVSNHYKPMMFDDEKNIWLLLCVTTLATKNHSIETYIEFDATDERYIYSPSKKKFILAENVRLSLKEKQVITLAAQGFTTKEIATKQKISVSTVKFHKQNILYKLNVENISEATLYAYTHNLC